MHPIPKNKELPLESRLLEIVNKIKSRSKLTNVYSIQFSGVPWWGSLLSWVTAFYAISLTQYRNFTMDADDNWRLVPRTERKQRNWRFYFDSLEIVAGVNFATRRLKFLGNISRKNGYKIL